MDSAASDPFFLDWGSSVNVNEDLRRTILADIDDIQSSTQSLQNSIKLEERCAAQLTKDFSHAYDELTKLHRFAREDRENSTMNMQIQMRLRESLANEVVSVVTPPSSPELESGVIEKDCGKEGNSENKKDYKMNLGRFIAKCSAEVKNIKKTIRTELKTQAQLKETLTSLEYEIQSIEDQIEKQKGAQCVVDDEVEVKQKEHDAEKQRIRVTKESIQIARKQCGDHAQKIADYSKRLSQNKRVFSEIESKLMSELAQNEEDVANLERELTSKEKTQAALSTQHENLILQFTEWEDILKKREVKKLEREKICEDIEILREQEKELANQLITVKEQHNAVEVKLNESRKRKKVVEELKAKNDSEEKQIVEPAKLQHMKYLEQKEDLARELVELDKKSASAQKSFDIKHAENEAILTDLKLQIKMETDRIESQKEEIKKIEAQKEKLRLTAGKEIEEHEKFRKSFEEATKAQHMRFEEQMELLEQTKKKQIEALKIDIQKTREAEAFKLEVIKRGVQIISETEKMESRLRAEVRLDENGEEIEEQLF